jgi:hypothetical protein
MSVRTDIVPVFQKRREPMVSRTTGAVPHTIDVFLDDLLAAKQYGELPEDVYTDMKRELAMRLNESIVARALERLPEREVDEFARLAEAGASDEAVAAFLREKIPDQIGFLAEVFSQFRRTFLKNG